MKSTHVAIVTGAGSGIGRAAALLLAQSHYAVALAGRTESKLKETQQHLRDTVGQNVEVISIPTDVSDNDQVGALIEQTLEAFGQIDALANIAGYAAMQPIAQTTVKLWRDTIDINLTGPVLLTAAAWPHLAKRGGVIVNVSSMASIDPFPGLGLYAAAKTGLNMFTTATATEGQANNIQAVAIAPGAVETPMLRGLIDEQSLPTEKTLTPQTVAQVIADCITGERTFTPGELIVLESPT